MSTPSISTSPLLRKSIQNAELAVNVFEKSGLQERAADLNKCIEQAKSLKFSIGVVAQAKRGKSTLINGLLGRTDDELAPIDRFPATNVVSCFANTKDEYARILFEGDTDSSSGKRVAYPQIKDYACEEHNPNNQKGVKTIEVLGRFPRLGEDVVLVDTPGADNALNKVHDVVLLEFLPKLDVVIFLVSADAPLVASELELLQHIRKNDIRKLLFAMNKVDDFDEDELREGLIHNRKALTAIGFDDVPIFQISAKNFHSKGADAGTEQLIQALGDVILNGRAAIITERLIDITNTHIKEAEMEIRSAIESAELTNEQIKDQISSLDEMKRNIERDQLNMEHKFREAWRNAYDDFEDSLRPIQRQLIHDYTGLIEGTSATKLNDLGNMIHTDVVKRLDELLQPNIDKLTKSLDSTTRTLQVETLSSMGIEPRDATAVLTRKQTIADAAGTVLAGAPALVGAAITGTIPGLVSSAIAASAPSVAALTWNPFTWIAAVGTGVANASVSTAAGAAGAILSPLALIGTPILVGYAGLRVFSSWRHKVGQTRNELCTAVKDMIVGAIDETRKNLRQARSMDDRILEQFRDNTASKINEARLTLNDLIEKRPSPERLAELKMASKCIQTFEGSAKLSAPDADTPADDTQRIFP